MKRMLPVLCAAMALGLALAACGGGGDDSGGLAPESLAGSWFGHGTIPAQTMDFFTLRIEVNDSGDITDVLINGFGSGWTGAVTASTASGNVFEVAMSNGSRAIIMSDGAATHFAFIHDYGIVGVLQKGATSLPAFEDTDMVGSWSGYSIETDSSFGIIAAGASSVTVAPDLTFAGTGLEGDFTGAFSDSAAPMWGTFSGVAGTEAIVFHLCPDKTFAGSFECGSDIYMTFPACTFSVMAK